MAYRSIVTALGPNFAQKSLMPSYPLCVTETPCISQRKNDQVDFILSKEACLVFPPYPRYIARAHVSIGQYLNFYALA
jgi:hypothetical protein